MDENEEVKTEINEPGELDFNLQLPDSTTDLLMGEMSEVSENAIDGEAEREAMSIGQMYDRDGNTFDPSIHVTTPDNKPVLNKDKTLKKKRGVKVGSKKSSVSGAISEPLETVDGGSKEAGKVAANLLITLGCTIGGEEWQPIKSAEHGIDEQINLEHAFSDYFEATGRTDFPPGFALVIAVGAYTLPRFRAPQTKSKFKRLMEWGYFKFHSFRNKDIPSTKETVDGEEVK